MLGSLPRGRLREGDLVAGPPTCHTYQLHTNSILDTAYNIIVPYVPYRIFIISWRKQVKQTVLVLTSYLSDWYFVGMIDDFLPLN